MTKGRTSLVQRLATPAFLFLLLPGLLAGPASAAETGVVEEVVDGDTLLVRTAGSVGAVTVRLIGIDAPERTHPSLGKEFFSDEAAAHLTTLCRGKTVRLEKDAEETDKYDRLLRYVFLPPPDGRLLNEEMLRAGMARAYTRYPFFRKDAFLAAEGRARREGKGLWKDGGMAEARWLAAGNAAPVKVFPSGGRTFVLAHKGLAKAGVERGDLPREIEGILQLRGELSDTEFTSKARDRGFRPIDPSKEIPTKSGSPGQRALQPVPTVRGTIIPWEDAHRHLSEEIVVEGTIVRTHRAKSVMYLNFHPNWKRYLTLVIFVKDLPLFPGNPEMAYKGKKVRVRGEVKVYKDRLEMVVRSPEDITVVQ
ncbi:thermonuclease family protein [Candidatus Deferrimicrobium sp.]|uniref:thermonuclease family protein n=1 Tax=Candidatus Deferrimicrobium sp. TaxID=3060586 RepID=UPI002ED3DA35